MSFPFGSHSNKRIASTYRSSEDFEHFENLRFGPRKELRNLYLASFSLVHHRNLANWSPPGNSSPRGGVRRMKKDAPLVVRCSSSACWKISSLHQPCPPIPLSRTASRNPTTLLRNGIHVVAGAARHPEYKVLSCGCLLAEVVARWGRKKKRRKTPYQDKKEDRSFVSSCTATRAICS